MPADSNGLIFSLFLSIRTAVVEVSFFVVPIGLSSGRLVLFLPALDWFVL
ncbi:hypothetical protein [Arsenophonus sp.]|nr:hypothetical protein [Arsenophonus sp.]MDR5618340.1 hypothetical protein [Arsenophonus sp.]